MDDNISLFDISLLATVVLLLLNWAGEIRMRTVACFTPLIAYGLLIVGAFTIGVIRGLILRNKKK